ncbi:uncharacterized protein (TIGR04141 family) [Gelidibacter algens]|uniref:Uncharacterized protein (TIGR04141 family) n=1 Tax=Gelidibacter algens TaxID=49280 RepID=A0A327RRY1_9FLAO|nr:DUF6119 family protein [Gelidibacter algens]RAJ19746.1 uncharacterized protein (TIGR04141 family) [Gelidibacter algens]
MKINPKVYKINKAHRLLSKYPKSEDICKAIIRTSKLKFNPKFELKDSDYRIYIEDEVERDGGIWSLLYSFKTPEIESEWSEFFPANFIEGIDFIQQKVSVIFFIEFQSHLYVIIGGNAFRIIQPFIEDNFGINIYSRILDPENDELISIKTRSITGKIASSSNYYKNDFKLIDHIKFGTLPTEINLKLDSKSNDYFNFLKKNKNDNVQIHVSNSLKFRKVIEFKDLLEIVKELKYLEELDKKDYLSTYEKIDDINFIENTLIEKLVTTIYEDINYTLSRTRRPVNKFYFEFCHPSRLENFYEADYFQLIELNEKKHIMFKQLVDRNEIYYEVLFRAIERFGNQISYDEFKYFLFGVRIRSYKNESKKNLTSAMFLHHFNTEFEINKRPLFLLDNNWYYLQDSFLADLNRNCERILKTYRAPKTLLQITWNLSINNTEKKYNLQYRDLKNYLVFDTITISGIELCDVLYHDENTLYLIHVKRGFDSSMRELYNQVILSARRLEESKSSKEKDYLKKCFKALVKKEQNNQIKSFDDFLKLFNKNH